MITCVAMMAMGAGLVGPPAGAAAPFGVSDGSWRLVWSDEFDGAAVDAAKWRVEDARVFNNQELQYYTPESVSVRDGVLTIRAEKRSFKGCEYTSGLMDTRATFAMAYGRYECRAKLPKGQGMWPAVWMLPRDDRWPPEIDIMENLGQDTHRIHTTHHWGPAWPNNQKTTGHVDGPDYSADFHVFSVEWAPEKIDWFIDGVKAFSSDANIPSDPFYFILNLAVGGNWGGNPDSTTVFPQTLEVDWVRAYQKVGSTRPTLLTEAEHGEVNPEPRAWVFERGAEARVLAEPDIGYVFTRWEGDVTGTANPSTVKMDGAKRVQAVFEKRTDGPLLLSGGKRVRASSSEGWGMEAERAVDASLWTRWSSKFEGEQWIEVDLGETRSIEAVKLAWASAKSVDREIRVSEDGKNWRVVGAYAEGKGGAEKVTGLDVRGRYVRVVGLKRGFSLFALEVYGR